MIELSNLGSTSSCGSEISAGAADPHCRSPVHARGAWMTRGSCSTRCFRQDSWKNVAFMEVWYRNQGVRIHDHHIPLWPITLQKRMSDHSKPPSFVQPGWVQPGNFNFLTANKHPAAINSAQEKRLPGRPCGQELHVGIHGFQLGVVFVDILCHQWSSNINSWTISHS